VIKKKRTLAKHLEKALKPNKLPRNEDLEAEINKALKEPLRMTQPIKYLTPKEIQIIKLKISSQGKPLDMTQLHVEY
jgi:hypothetical protein